jgi:hypothetical protein
MKQYKTIAGPVALKVSTALGGLRPLGSNDYEDSVRQYAKIIDKEAIGGWALLLIQRIEVKKIIWWTVLVGALLGAILSAITNFFGMFCCCESVGSFFLGLLIGGTIGCLGIRGRTELFNMLVFEKDDAESNNINAPMNIPATTHNKQNTPESDYSAQFRGMN